MADLLNCSDKNARNGQTVNNIEDYMYRMSQLKHGQTISVEVMRDDKKLVLIIQI